MLDDMTLVHKKTRYTFTVPIDNVTIEYDEDGNRIQYCIVLDATKWDEMAN